MKTSVTDDLSDDDEGDKSDQPSPNPTPSPEPSTVSPNLEDSNNISVQQDKSPSVSPLLLSPPKVIKRASRQLLNPDSLVSILGRRLLSFGSG